MPKEAVFTVKLEASLRDAFMAEAEAVHRPASQLVRDFMRDFVQHRRDAREHDRWFSAKVREALDDSQPGVAHDQVMDEIRAIIDRVAADHATARGSSGTSWHGRIWPSW